jgi:hypothetical protein
LGDGDYKVVEREVDRRNEVERRVAGKKKRGTTCSIMTHTMTVYPSVTEGKKNERKKVSHRSADIPRSLRWCCGVFLSTARGSSRDERGKEGVFGTGLG